jgi:predicted metalloprotease with PDZ domain
MSRPRTLVVLALALSAFASPELAIAQAPARAGDNAPPVEYTVTLDRPQTQMVHIAMLVRSVGTEPVTFMLPVWRPGRYVVLNQSSGLRDVKAFGDAGQALQIEKIDKATWRVDPAGSRDVRVEYGIYANALADRTRHVDDTHAFLSGEAVFMYNPQRRGWPCSVRIDKPENWSIATGLDTDPRDSNTLTAANYDVLVDSPIEIGVHDLLEFQAAGKPHQIVIWGKADYKADELIADFTKIIEEETRIFGSAPYQRYMFILHVGAGASGGTEHINSTIMQISRAALEEPEAYRRLLSLAAHEFFHTWNVKSFRPEGIHPYDYQRENYTRLLWVAEGATSYYDDMLLVRTGHVKPAKYLETLGNAIDSMRNRPAETVQSIEQASFDAWIQFAAHSPDDVNAKVDFYSKGSLVSLLIDLEMRRRSNGRANLEQVMRALYQRFPMSGPGYSTQDLQRIIEELSGSRFDELFQRHVRGAEPIDFTQAFAYVGLEMHFKPARREPSDEQSEEPETQPSETEPEDDEAGASDAARGPATKAHLGLNLSDAGGKTTVTSTPSDGPAFLAGVLAGDEIIALDGRRLTAATLDGRLKSLKPGDTVTLTCMRRDELRSVTLTLAAKPDGKWTLRKTKHPTDDQKAAWEAWLGQAW